MNHWTEKMAPAQQRLKAEPAATLNGAFAVLMTTPATNSRIEVGLPVAMATVAGTFCPCSIRKQISTTRVVHRETSFAPFACMRKHAPAIQFTCDLHIMGLSCSSYCRWIIHYRSIRNNLKCWSESRCSSSYWLPVNAN